MNSTAICILGMHRSGTSTIARAVNLLGAYLGEPEELMPPHPDNAEGYWERLDVWRLHEEILTTLNTTWDAVLPLPEQWWQLDEVRTFKSRIRRLILEEFNGHALWAWKDPRTCLLFPLWKEVLSELGVKLHVVYVSRHPLDIAKSMQKRDGFQLIKGYGIWLNYSLQALRSCKGLPTTFVSYDKFLTESKNELSRIISSINLSMAVDQDKIEDSLKGVVKTNLRHSLSTIDDLSGAPLSVKRLYPVITKACDDNALDYEEINNQATYLSDFESLIRQQLDEQRGLKAKADGYLYEILANKYNVSEIKNCQSELSACVLEKRNEIAIITNSMSWRITGPLRHLGDLVRRDSKGATYAPQTIRPVGSTEDASYEQWVKCHDTLGAEDYDAIRKHISTFVTKPVLTLIISLSSSSGEKVSNFLNSLSNQLYPYWQLIVVHDRSLSLKTLALIEKFRDEHEQVLLLNSDLAELTINDIRRHCAAKYIAIIDRDIVLSEHALYFVALTVITDPSTVVIYADDDVLGEFGRRTRPRFKPDWNHDLFLATNYLAGFVFVREEWLRTVGNSEFILPRTTNYSLLLRVTSRLSSSQIRHIPHILSHAWAVSDSVAASIYKMEITALADFFRVTETGVIVEEGLVPGSFHCRFPLPSPPPLVSIIIPTRDGEHLLRACVESIRKKTTYPNYEIIVVDNQSRDPDTLDYFSQLRTEDGIRILSYDAPFNYSAINNFAAAKANGEILALLNNDMEVIAPDWLTEMVSNAIRPGVGAVGAKLYYPDGRIQHGGVTLGLGPVAGHAYQYVPGNHRGHMDRLMLMQNFLAVTAACLVIRKKLYYAVRGLNEHQLTIAYNDVDFCFKLAEEGLRNVWTPYAELYHHESVSRGYDITPDKLIRVEKEVSYMLGHWKHLIVADPTYNPNLSLTSSDSSLAFPPRTVYPWRGTFNQPMNTKVGA